MLAVCRAIHILIVGLMATCAVRAATGLPVVQALPSGVVCKSGVQAAGQWLYGAVIPDAGAGEVFAVRRDGSMYTPLHTFGSVANDGVECSSALFVAPPGVLFGTTRSGGTNDGGTVFRVATNGTGYAILHHFGGDPNEGATLDGRLVLGANGKLYGTTSGGGSNGVGTVFSLATNGTAYTQLHHFGDGTDGAFIYGGLVIAPDGALLGATWGGGANNGGVIFRLAPDGSDYRVLHDFGSVPGDGEHCYAGLVIASNGTVFGTTVYGGTNDGGVVFSISADGREYTILRQLAVDDDSPRNVFQGLLLDGEMLYGASYGGGTNQTGAIFSLLTNGADYNLLYNFGSDATPSSPLSAGTDGSLLGAVVGATEGDQSRIFALPVAPQLAFVEFSGGSHLQAIGIIGSVFTLESSTNLSNWSAVLTTNLSLPRQDVSDFTASGVARFYRTRR